jgi:hypothetical protein
LIEEIVREDARRMPAAALEAEVNSYIAELAAETDEHGHRSVVRNGRHRPRTVVTAAGPVEVRAPRADDRRIDEETGGSRRFSSKILPPWYRKLPKIAEALPESAQARWRAITRAHLVPLVPAGARFENGQLGERNQAVAA